MQGEEILAADVAAEIVVQATLHMPEPPTDDDDALALTVAEFKQAVIAVLARYGARLTDEDDDTTVVNRAPSGLSGDTTSDLVEEHELARLHDKGNPNHD